MARELNISRFIACEQEKVNEPKPILVEEGNMVLVGQEGNYKWGNASLGLINLEKNQIYWYY